MSGSAALGGVGAAAAAAARIGVDLGGTKISGIVLARDGRELARVRVASPQGDYQRTVTAVAGVVGELERQTGLAGSVGVGIPGSLAPRQRLVQNANSTWLIGKPLQDDLEQQLGRPVRLENDANCFAVSEAADGAAAGARVVFGVILGTGCGGGIVVDGRVLDGPRGIGGEWGHNPLPWAAAEEHPGPRCWCGRNGCMETWVSGTGLAADHNRRHGARLTAVEISVLAAAGDPAARETLALHTSRLARGLALVCNLIDPHVIVLGGGLSALSQLYRDLPDAMVPHLFAADAAVTIRPPRWGDDSGVRGAAWLWP